MQKDLQSVDIIWRLIYFNALIFLYWDLKMTRFEPIFSKKIKDIIGIWNIEIYFTVLYFFMLHFISWSQQISLCINRAGW